MYDKNAIDQEAEQEARALRKQGFKRPDNYKRTRQAADYSQERFEELFR